MTKRISGTVEERLWGRVEKTSACWFWTGCKSPEGYGRIRVDGVTKYAHRIAWESQYGPIPKGLMIDHQCRVRHCVNPAHLKVVSNKQNAENAGISARNKSGFRGVSWYPRYGKWVGRVKHFGRLINVGYFDTVGEANAAVVAKRNELYVNNPADRAFV